MYVLKDTFDNVACFLLFLLFLQLFFLFLLFLFLLLFIFFVFLFVFFVFFMEELELSLWFCPIKCTQLIPIEYHTSAGWNPALSRQKFLPLKYYGPRRSVFMLSGFCCSQNKIPIEKAIKP